MPSRRCKPPRCNRATAATKLKPSPAPGVVRAPSRRTKRSDNTVALGGRHPWAIVQHVDLHASVGPLYGPHLNPPPGRRILQRVLNQVGHRLGKQTLIAAYGQALIDVCAEAQPLLFGRRFVELHQFTQNAGDVDTFEPPIARRLDAGEFEDGGKHVEQSIGFLDRLAQRFTVGVRVRRRFERGFQLLAKTGERRAQVMCDRVARRSRRLHQRFDAVEHAVHGLREFVEFIADAEYRRASRQIAAHDLARGAGQHFGAPRRLPGRQ